MLTGYFKPTSGTIHVKGLDIEDHLLDVKKKKKLQHYHMNYRMTGLSPENLPIILDGTGDRNS